MKTIVVFGAGGFVGGEFSNRVLSDNNYHLIRVLHSGVEDEKKNTYVADLCDMDSVERILRKYIPDAVINLAGINSIAIAKESPGQVINTNVIGSANVLEAVRKSCPKAKVLLIGSSEIYADSTNLLSEADSRIGPRNVYGYTKLWQEQLSNIYVKRYSMNIIATRSFNHTGVSQKENAMISSFCRQAAQIVSGKRDPVINVGNLDIDRDISDVRDVVNAYIKLLEEDVPRGIYNVCSGEKTRLRHLLDTIIGFTEMPIEVRQDSSRVRHDDLKVIVGDNKKLKEVTGWSREYTMIDTLRNIYDWKLKEEMGTP